MLYVYKCIEFCDCCFCRKWKDLVDEWVSRNPPENASSNLIGKIMTLKLHRFVSEL